VGATFTAGGAADQVTERLRQMDAALAAFAQATSAMGMSGDVATVTEPDLCGDSGQRVRLAMGGRVLGGEFYAMARADVDGALAEWSGQGNALPAPSASSPQFLY
jgi:hypothetical protein